MKKTFCLITLLMLIIPSITLGQSARLDYDNLSLNDILLDLTDRYKVQISINPDIANKCLITIHDRFRNMDLAMEALSRRCQLRFRKIEGIYTFFPVPDEPEQQQPKARSRKRPQYLYQGMVIENHTNEPVPYAMMQFDGRGIVADENGLFSFKSFNLEEQGLFRSLGYNITDTTIAPGTGHRIRLNPALIELQDVEVIANNGLSVTNIGEQAGHLKFNDIGNNLVPGLSDNLIFNNLRLYPGVMAAGEAITDFVIWGSYAGQNHVTYDGITLFNSWGINDDMGRINPYMIRNVEVYKGAFNVPFGDRIGGVVQMDGTSGNLNKKELQASLTNQLANVYVNIPVSGKATLQLAGRKTLFENFDLSTDFDQGADLIVPQYDYSDFNLKFVASLSNDDRIELSGIYSEDGYSGNLQNVGRRNIINDLRLNSTQAGLSAGYAKNWKSGGISKFETSYSNYDPTVTANYLFNLDQRPIGDTLRSYAWTNPVQEFKTSLTHTFSATSKHQVKLNASYISNQISLNTNVDQRVIEDNDVSLDRVSFYMLNDFQWTDRFSIQLGLKADLPSGGDIHLQPRLNARYDIGQRWNVHLGWGIYNQFISKNPVVDEVGNRSEVWQLADGESAPVLESMHTVLGLAYNHQGFELGIEGFYKEAGGFGRYTFNRDRDVVFRELDAEVIGMEVFARKGIGPHNFWTSYTLLEVKESLANIRTNVERLAPQSQKHEFKAAVVLNFSPFQFSVTSVYGSGFPNRSVVPDQARFNIYRRTDLAAQFTIDLSGVDMDLGLSILNVFNQENVRLNQTVNSPTGARINTVGIPFTTTFYVNLRL